MSVLPVYKISVTCAFSVLGDQMRVSEVFPRTVVIYRWL